MGRVTQSESGKRALSVGTILMERYRINRVLGEGGFGVTYEATQLDMDRKVAIKEYFPASYATRENADLDQNLHIFLTETEFYEHGMQRFLQEAELLKSVQYLDGIVSVMDCFSCNRTAYIVMEYVEGITLKQYIQENGCLEYGELLELLLPVMKSLHCIHRQGLLHRDISPDNLLIGLDNQARLIDFGAADMMDAKNKKEMTVILKAGYAPPEQYLTDGRQGPWTDVYALAAMMYMALTGNTPVAAVARLQGKNTIAWDQPGLHLTAWQQHVIETGLALKISDRYKNVEEFLNDLMSEPQVEDEVTQFQSDVSGKVRHQIKGLDRSKKRLIVVGVILLALFSVVGWLTINRSFDKSVSDNTTQEQGDSSQDNKELCLMPNIIGLQEDAAREQIRNADSKIQITIQEKNSAEEKGIVIGQNVAADTQYYEGAITEIILTVSLGEESEEDISSTEQDTTSESATNEPTTEKEEVTTRQNSSGKDSEEKATKKQNSTTQSSKKDVKVIEENDYDKFQID